jgi:hypothetical protein
VGDLPHSTRSVTDLKNRRIYLTQNARSDHDPRSVLLQALGHYVLGHQTPTNYGDFLMQRVATNYFAAALLLPEQATVEFLQKAKQAKEIAVEDIRDAFAVSYETAAHRFTNLATQHLDLRTHFQKTHKSGIIYKAYENDGVTFPQDHTGAIEGQPSCKNWTSRVVFDVPDKFSAYNQYTDTPAGTFWCTARTERSANGEFSLSVGVPYAQVKWFRGRDTTERSKSTCPDESCCRRPPAALTSEWAGNAWPSARAHSHLLAAMPPGAFPGVDETEVYSFLQAHSGSCYGRSCGPGPKSPETFEFAGNPPKWRVSGELGALVLAVCCAGQPDRVCRGQLPIAAASLPAYDDRGPVGPFLGEKDLSHAVVERCHLLATN